MDRTQYGNGDTPVAMSHKDFSVPEPDKFDDTKPTWVKQAEAGLLWGQANHVPVDTEPELQQRRQAEQEDAALSAAMNAGKSSEMILIQFPHSPEPQRIALRNWPGAKACGAKLVEEPAPVHMKETVNGHAAPSATPRIRVFE